MSVCLDSDSYSHSLLATATLGLFTIDSASMFVTHVEARRPAHTRRLNSDTARSDSVPFYARMDVLYADADDWSRDLLI